MSARAAVPGFASGRPFGHPEVRGSANFPNLSGTGRCLPLAPGKPGKTEPRETEGQQIELTFNFSTDFYSGRAGAVPCIGGPLQPFC